MVKIGVEFHQHAQFQFSHGQKHVDQQVASWSIPVVANFRIMGTTHVERSYPDVTRIVVFQHHSNVALGRSVDARNGKMRQFWEIGDVQRVVDVVHVASLKFEVGEVWEAEIELEISKLRN